ncbi:hypothetical protein ABLI39_08040 [Pseudarthrobacter sp. B907]|uniref:hypothetical protein n=1 Tax=Pseudarthrobacter sp. B907 TaxID=3158261 RepID=UPI0032DB5F2A
MAGNSVYGKGYHDGSTDARQQDLLIAGVVVATAALVKVSLVSYDKLKQMQASRMEKRMLASAQNDNIEAADKDDLDGPTRKAQQG